MKASGTLLRLFAVCVGTAVLTGFFVHWFAAVSMQPSGSQTSLGPTIFAVVLAGVTSCGLTWYASRGLRRRLRSVRHAAEAIAAGNLDRRIHDHHFDEVGGLAAAFNSMTDQLRDRIEAVNVESNRLASILESMVEGVVATDRQERIVHINAAAARMLGVSEREVLGKPVWQATRSPELHDLLAEAMRGKVGARTEITRPSASDDEVIEMRASSLVDTNRSVRGAVVVLHDVSHLRRLERIRRDFVSNVSHELKTPLMAIQGIVETMLDDPDMDPETSVRFLARLRNQSERLGSLVHDLLELSRVESLQVAQERVRIDLRQAIRNSIEHSAPYADEKDIRLSYDEHDEPLMVLGDSEMLRQLADNLLQNAIKYTPGDGSVSARCFRRDDSAIFEVRDSGIGIERKHLGRIFERFYRVDKARSRELGGTGLGLSIVKHVALAHDGNVEVESEPGVGSCFRLSLPLASD
ncbi:MAG: PAS domain-containing protein [Planctomycetes bacterium]|nr:PAS domain-containing protein [Planctomycetota bacterium]